MTGPDYGPWFDRTIGPLIHGSKILLVGTGSSQQQYETKPMDFKAQGAECVVYLEAWYPYCEKWAGGKTPVVYGNIVRGTALFAKRSWDIVLFDQGIEHFGRDYHGKVLSQMYDLSQRAAVATCPFGSYYDGQGAVNGNPFETHHAKNLTGDDFRHHEGWNVLEFGEKDAGDAQVAIWRIR